MEELISIIIPVYNVEKYLERCINSVLNQTYPNIEVILIDDGSTDKSGEICDKYKQNYDKIRVIHKKNEGLSEARNLGIKLAKGKYIGFVDSDDYILQNMYELLYNNIINLNADISICKYLYKREWEKINIKDSKILYCYSSTDALNKLLENKEITNHSWNKLYKKELFEDVYFPKGKKYEDMAVMYRIFKKCKNIVFQDTTQYIYINRKGSILHNKNEQLIRDYIEIIDKRYEELNEIKELQKSLKINMFFSLIQIHIICIGGHLKKFYNSEIMQQQSKKLQEMIKENDYEFLNWKYKLFIKLFKINRNFTYKIFSIVYFSTN